MSALTAGAGRARWFVVVVAVALLGVAGVRGQGTTTRKDALPAFLFRVEIEGVEVGFFRSVSGLDSETEVVEFREGGSDVIQKLPGVRKYPNLVLKRGFTGDTALYDWFQSNTRQHPVRANGKIVMLNSQLAEVATWQFHNGFPAKWEGPDLNASTNGVAIETLEIAHEGWVLTTPDRPVITIP